MSYIRDKSPEGRRGVSKAEDNSIEQAILSIQKNRDFKNTIRFALNVLEKSVTKSGSYNFHHVNKIILNKGHVELAKVLKIHAKEPDFSRAISTITKAISVLSEDERLPDKLVECGYADSLKEASKQE